MNVTFYPDHNAIRQMATPSGIIGSAVLRAGERTAQRTKAAITSSGRVKSGRMRAGVRLGPFAVRGDSVTQRVEGSENYTIFQNSGTRFITGARFFESAIRQLNSSDFRSS